MDYLVCHKRNYSNYPETEDTISETTIDLAGLEQAVLHFYNHDSYLAAHDWIEIHPILQGRPHQAVPIPPARYQSQVASSAEMQKGLNVINRLTNQLDMLKTEQAFLAIARRDLWALQRALSASISVSQHHEATQTGEKINGVPVSELKELDLEIAARSGGAPMRQSQPDGWEALREEVKAMRLPELQREINETTGVTPVTADVADRAATLLAKLDEQAENYGELRMVQLSDADVRTLRAAIPYTYRKEDAPDAS